MAIKIQDRVKQGTNTTGSGTITFHVSYASSGFDDFSVLGNGSKTYYAIEEAPSGWEVGIGTYNSNTLSRDTVFDSSAGGAKINLGGSGLVFVTLPASKIVIADENNNVSVTGLDVGATGIVFNDGTKQTTAFTGIAGFATEAYVTGASGHLQTQISSNDSDIAANLAKITGVSGTAATNTSNISNNTTNIAANTIRLADVSGSVDINTAKIGTVSGTVDTNTTNIATNTAKIGTVSGTVDTNTTNIATNTARLGTVSGSVDINTAKITGVSGVAASKDNYQYWTVSDGATDENVTTTEKITFTGAGNTSVSYSSNVVTISGSSAGGGGDGYDFNVSAGGSADTISSGQTVIWTGLGNNTVTYNSSSNTFSISGADQDLSSYATQSYVTGASGHLQSQINTNDTDISNLSGLVSSNTSNISTASGTLQSQITSNTTDISNTSGDLYGHWIISAGAVQENVAKTEKVKFTGTGATTVSYNAGTNTLTVNTPSSEAGYEYWTATDGSANTSSVANGQAVRITGAGNVTVDFASGSPNIFTVSGADQDLSSYATQAYVTGASGHLQTQISSNVTDIAANTARLADVSGSVDINTAMITGVSGTAATNTTNITTNVTNIAANTARLGTVSGSVDINTAMITGVSGTAATNTSSISTNTTNIAANTARLADVSGSVDINTAKITGVSGNLNTVSGLLYTSWTVSDGLNSEAITAGGQVNFTGGGNTTVSYNTSSNTVTISGNDATNTYNAGSGLNEDPTKTFNVQTDNSTLEVNSDIVRIKDNGVTNAKLANTGVTVTAGTGLTNGGVVALGASVTVDAITASTSAAGVVQLQDAVTNGTTDKAVTPNAVYDMSGVINGNINSYTAGSGLNLDGTEFDVKLDNSTLEFNSDIIQIKDDGVTNAKLANTGVTVTAGTGLTNGGVVALGASVTVDAITASTSAAGVVQLQDTVTNGTTNRAVTPNAVYDMSGVLVRNAGSGIALNTNDLDIKLDNSTIEFSSDIIQIKDDGVTNAKLASDVNLDAVTDNGATTTNGINVGMIDTSGVRSSMQSGAGSSPGDTRNLDLSQASTFHHSMNSGLNNITLTNVTAGQKFVLRLTQNATATGTVSFFGGVRWPGGTVPTLTATTSKTDVFGFLCVVSGSYDGFIIGQNI